MECYEKENQKLSIDVPVLQRIVNSTWRKEEELNGLKSELAAVDRKIQLSLAPVDTSEDKKEDLQKNETQLPENVTKRLNEYRNEMSNRLVVATIPKIGEEKVSGRRV